MKSYNFTNRFRNDDIECQKKGKNDEKEICSMDIDIIDTVFGTGSGCDGEGRFEQTTWNFGKRSG